MGMGSNLGCLHGFFLFRLFYLYLFFDSGVWMDSTGLGVSRLVFLDFVFMDDLSNVARPTRIVSWVHAYFDTDAHGVSHSQSTEKGERRLHRMRKKRNSTIH